jgi:hypothetical protein
MMLLPKDYKFVEMLHGYCQNMAHIGLTSLAWPDSVCPVRKRDRAIRAKIGDDFDLGIETMHMPWLVVHPVNHEPDAVEPDRTHLFLY